MGTYQSTDLLSQFFNAFGGWGTLIFVLLVIVLIFLAIREILCWYWKLNEIRDRLEDIGILLKRIEVNTAQRAKEKTVAMISPENTRLANDTASTSS
jgi:hypothetical protein